MKMKSLFVFCFLFLFTIKNIFKKCLCISTRTKHSDKDTKYQLPTGLSFKHPQNKLGVIYEDIEYVSISDNTGIKQYIFYS